MAVFILATKIGQSQMFDINGQRIPVTHLRTSPCYVIDIKTAEKDGYWAIKLGFRKAKKNGKSVRGQITKVGIDTPLQYMREIRLDCIAEKVKSISEELKNGISIDEIKYVIGSELKSTEVLKIDDMVNVSGISKGKGFQGVVKRHGFRGGPRTHGQSDRERAPGSMGQTTTPGRTYKGKRMAGRMGGDRITVSNLKVVKVEDQGITIKGLVPGSKNTLLEIVSY